MEAEARIISTTRRHRGEIRPSMEHNKCVICERTMLVGEVSHFFAEPHDGTTVLVCSICRDLARSRGLKSVDQVA